MSAVAGRCALVVNPTAGRGRAGRLVPTVSAALREALPGTELTIVESRDVEHAESACRQAVADAATVLVMGGDGMAHLGVNACAGTGVPLGVLPAGTGNDLCRGLGLPLQIRDAVKALARGLTHSVDLAHVTKPDGAERWRYAKSHGVPGYEERYMARGDGRLVSASTPFGRVAGMICFDADHSGMLRQLGGAHDLLLLPSDDWPAIEWLHAAMVRIRAIEQGIAIARPTINGRSVAYDARGRVVAELPAGSSGTTLAAQLPLAREATPFVRIGDALSWVCVAALGLLAFASRRRRTAAHPVAA